jgi:hypothetical protein
MMDQAIIIKFLGTWPSKAMLKWWAKTHWNLKGAIELKIGEKGFFTIMFSCVEDWEAIFEACPYFFNSTRRYMQY